MDEDSWITCAIKTMARAQLLVTIVQDCLHTSGSADRSVCTCEDRIKKEKRWILYLPGRLREAGTPFKKVGEGFLPKCHDWNLYLTINAWETFLKTVPGGPGILF